MALNNPHPPFLLHVAPPPPLPAPLINTLEVAVTEQSSFVFFLSASIYADIILKSKNKN